MRIAGLKILQDFIRRHPDVESQIAIWVQEVKEAQWQDPKDIKDRYAHASILADNRVIFNIRGNRYRLDTKVSFKNQIVLVVRIGTHEEYDRWQF